MAAVARLGSHTPTMRMEGVFERGPVVRGEEEKVYGVNPTLGAVKEVAVTLFLSLLVFLSAHVSYSLLSFAIIAVSVCLTLPFYRIEKEWGLPSYRRDPAKILGDISVLLVG